MKTCTKCHELKPDKSFVRDKQKGDGIYPSCKVCKEKHSMGSKLDIFSKICGGIPYCQCPKCPLYKIPIDLSFLEIDHKYNNGFQFRKIINKSGHLLCKWLKKSQIDLQEYQILCSNCNRSKETNRGICFHLLGGI